MTDLNDMIVFMKVVDVGSFTQAADQLNLPKSNISRKVTRLEQSLGVRLLERSTRSLHLTEIGRVYYQHCQRINEEVINADHCVQAMATIASGTIKLCCSVGVGQELLTPLLSKFKQQYPLINFDLELTNRRVDIIDEGFDLVIRIGESPDSNLISKKLLTVGMHLYATDHYIAKAQQQGHLLKTFEDIKDHQCLYMNAMEGKPRWELFEHTEKRYIEFTPAIQANDFYMLRAFAEQGLGITLLPDYFVRANSALTSVLPNLIGRSVNLYAVYPSRKGVTPKIKALLDFLSSNEGISKR